MRNKNATSIGSGVPEAVVYPTYGSDGLPDWHSCCGLRFLTISVWDGHLQKNKTNLQGEVTVTHPGDVCEGCIGNIFFLD